MFAKLGLQREGYNTTVNTNSINDIETCDMK